MAPRQSPPLAARHPVYTSASGLVGVLDVQVLHALAHHRVEAEGDTPRPGNFLTGSQHPHFPAKASGKLIPGRGFEQCHPRIDLVRINPAGRLGHAFIPKPDPALEHIALSLQIVEATLRAALPGNFSHVVAFNPRPEATFERHAQTGLEKLLRNAPLEGLDPDAGNTSWRPCPRSISRSSGVSRMAPVSVSILRASVLFPEPGKPQMMRGTGLVPCMGLTS